jgi:hypothetical protein
MNKEDAIEFIQEQINHDLTRLEITSQLQEMGVAQATSYRWYKAALEKWDDPQQKEDPQVKKSLEDQSLALDAIRDSLNASIEQQDNEAIAKFALSLLKARKLCRSI